MINEPRNPVTSHPPKQGLSLKRGNCGPKENIIPNYQLGSLMATVVFTKHYSSSSQLGLAIYFISIAYNKVTYIGKEKCVCCKSELGL